MTRFELLADESAETINGGFDITLISKKYAKGELRQFALNSSVNLGDGSANSNQSQYGKVVIFA
jgi:hypothetical protein